MKKTFVLVLILTCSLIGLHSEIQFPFSFGSIGADYGKDIRYDQDGNVYVTGYFQGTVDFDPSSSLFEMTAQGSPTVPAAVDIFVAKYDPEGSLMWAFPISSAGSDMPHSLFIKDGGFVLTGYIGGSADFDPDPLQQYVLNAGSGRDMFIASYSDDCNLEFAMRAGDIEEPPFDANDDRFEDGMDVCADESGNIYATGTYKWQIDLDPSQGNADYTSVNDSRDIYILSLDAAGNYRWGFSLGGTGQDHGHGVRILQVAELPLPEPQIHKTGNRIRLTWDALPHVEEYRIYGSEDPCAESWNYITHIGLCEWETSGDYDRHFYKITAVFPDYVRSEMAIVTGFFSGTVDFDPSASSSELTSVGGWDIFLAAYNASDGTFIWAKRMGGSGFDQVRPGGISIDYQGRILITGDFANTVDFDPGNGISSHTSNGSGDVFVATYNAFGEYVGSFSMGGSMSDFAHRITTDTLGNIVITGQFNASADFDPSDQQYILSANGSSGDVFVAKYSPTGDFLWANSFGGGHHRNYQLSNRYRSICK